jgi:hypothetical protein
VLICEVSRELGDGDKRVEKRAGQIRRLWAARTKSSKKKNLCAVAPVHSSWASGSTLFLSFGNVISVYAYQSVAL